MTIGRRLHGVVRVAALLATVALACAAGPAAFARLRPQDALILAGAAAFAAVLGLLRAPVAHFERSVRPTPESDRIGLVLPLLLAVFVSEGWYWAAALNLIAQLVRPRHGRKFTPATRVSEAALRYVSWPVFALAVDPFRAALLGGGPPAFVQFAVVAWAGVVLINFGWSLPLAALRRERSVAGVLLRFIRDLGSLATIGAEVTWGALCGVVLVRDGPFLGLLTCVPPLILAAVLVRFARVNARMHRLAISRDAVDAMLRANDPQPQLRSLLESIDPRIVRESVEVVARGRGTNDRWSRVMRFGPPVSAGLERLGGRVLIELQATDEDAAVETAEDGVVRAFASRDGEGGLRGALVVFRPPGATAHVAGREFTRAAAELGPLLGEYGTIAATRTAATIDTLTGLPNRRGVARFLEDAMAYVREGGRYAVLLLDVDHFKSINDLLGHQTGDRALAQIGRSIAENIRGVDVAGRFGGEEFLVLLRDASRDRAMQVAERLRAAIEASGLEYADGKAVTISIGVAYARPADSSDDVVERADRALYRAKNAGRNRVVESPLVAV